MHELARILSIRETRLDKARREEAEALAEVAAARRDLVVAQEAVDAYAEEIRTLEIDLLTELVGTELHRSDFVRLEEKLKSAETLARKLAAGLEDAAGRLAMRENESSAARRDRRELQSKTARISEVIAQAKEEEAQEQLLREDAEIDAFVETTAGRGRGGAQLSGGGAKASLGSRR